MSLNFKKGFLRLTIILSIIAGTGFVLFIAITEGIEEPIFEIPLAFAMGFVPVWLIFFFIKYIAIKYIIKGFKE